MIIILLWFISHGKSSKLACSKSMIFYTYLLLLMTSSYKECKIKILGFIKLVMFEELRSVIVTVILKVFELISNINIRLRIRYPLILFRISSEIHLVFLSFNCSFSKKNKKWMSLSRVNLQAKLWSTWIHNFFKKLDVIYTIFIPYYMVSFYKYFLSDYMSTY